MSDLVRYAREGYVNCNFGYIDAPDSEVPRGGWDAKICPNGCEVPLFPSSGDGGTGGRGDNGGKRSTATTTTTTTTTTTSTTTTTTLPLCNCTAGFVGDYDEDDDTFCMRPFFMPLISSGKPKFLCSVPDGPSAYDPPTCGGAVMCSKIGPAGAKKKAKAAAEQAAAGGGANNGAGGEEQNLPSLPLPMPTTYNYTGDECVEDLVITTPQPFIEPAYCCGHQLEEVQRDRNKRDDGGRSGGGGKAGSTKLPIKSAADAAKFRQVRAGTTLKVAADDAFPFGVLPPMFAKKNKGGGDSCRQLTHSECTNIAQVWNETPAPPACHDVGDLALLFCWRVCRS